MIPSVATTFSQSASFSNCEPLRAVKPGPWRLTSAPVSIPTSQLPFPGASERERPFRTIWQLETNFVLCRLRSGVHGVQLSRRREGVAGGAIQYRAYPEFCVKRHNMHPKGASNDRFNPHLPGVSQPKFKGLLRGV